MTRSMTPQLLTESLDSPNLTDKVEPINPKQAAALVQWARSEFSKMKTARLQAQRQWYYNLSMYYGKQYYDIVNLKSGNSLLRTPRAPKYRTRHTVNLIRPLIRQEIARMTSQKPTASVTPATTSTDDMFAAQAAEQVWEFLQQRRDFHAKMMRNAFWISIAGTGFMKTWWDDDYSGNTAILAQTNQPAIGDVLFETVTPFNLFVPDLLEQDIEGEPYAFEAYTRQVSWVRKFWPQVGDVSPNVVARNEIIETSYFNVQDGDNSKPDSVLVLECWIKPGGCDILPDGGMFTIIGDKLAQNPTPGIPYSHGQYPYTKFEHLPTGKFYGDSVLVDINPLQREYNRCYDASTEILTESGWKLGTNLSVGERVLTYDVNKSSMKFAPVLEMFQKEYSGPVTVLENSQISARTTPGHKWAVSTSSGIRKIVTELNSDHSIPLCAPVEVGYGDEDYSFNKIVGLVLTDGRINEHRVFISQSSTANPDKCYEIEDLLAFEGINFTQNVNSKGMIDYYIPVDYNVNIRRAIPNKKLTANYIMTLGQKGLEGLYDGMMLGDGMQDGTKGSKFYTSLESEANAFHMVCSLLGKAAVVRKRYARSEWAKRKFQYIVQVKTDKFSRASVFRAKKEDEQYNGLIWCPTVESGFVYVRRNGRSYISGNTRSHIIESKNRMARPQLLVAEGSMDTTRHTAEPGQHVMYKLGFPPPTPLPLTPLPAYVLQEQDRIKGDIEDISGQHSVSRGQVPGGGVTAATAISFLQEQDDSIMGPTYASIERGTEKIARQALALVVDRYSLPRIIETTGLDQSFDSLELKGADISRGVNLRIEGGSALPQSKSARQALVLDWFKLGAITREDMMDMLDIGGTTNITEKMRLDKKEAQRENLRMKKLTPDDIQKYEMEVMQKAQTGDPSMYDPNSGAPLVFADTPGTFPPVVAVNEWNNHLIHIQTHNDYRKSQEFETLPDEVKHQFEIHVQAHKQAMMTQMITNNGQMIPPDVGQQPMNPEQEGAPSEQSAPGPAF